MERSTIQGWLMCEAMRRMVWVVHVLHESLATLRTVTINNCGLAVRCSPREKRKERMYIGTTVKLNTAMNTQQCYR